MKWKKWLIGLLLVVVAFVIAAPRIKNFLILNSTQIRLFFKPIPPNQEVVWEKGPAVAEKTPENRPPNVVLILADDLGANDLTFAGGGVDNGSVPTPNIDSIAREGVSFSNGYAGHATCAPSRSAVLTGRYGSRVGFISTPGPAIAWKFVAELQKDATRPPTYIEERADEVPDSTEMGLPPEEITIAELLNENGYHSVMVGKWHLGMSKGILPSDQGFDEFVGLTGGASLYAPVDSPDYVNAVVDFDPIDYMQWKLTTYHVKTSTGGHFEPRGYVTDYYAEEAVKAIEANKNRPFFLYLAFNAPHSPLQATKADYDALSHIKDHRLRVYGAMIRALDRGVGQVLDTLKRNGLEENTLVIFASDNGAPGYLGLPDLNKPFRGWKMTFFEGGLNVPYFMKWPGRIPKGATYDKPVLHQDIFSTVAAAAGSPLPTDRKIDGVNLLPYVNGQVNGRPHESLFWDGAVYQSVMVGDWKYQVDTRTGKHWLFDMKADPTELITLADTRPEKRKELETALADFNRTEKAKPLWPSLLEWPVRVDETLDQSWEESDEYVTIAN